MKSTRAHSRFIRVGALGLAFAAAILPQAQVARADIVKAAYNSPFNFDYEVWHMPDLDQRRPGLVVNGEMHCVPASVLNKFIYIANHGYPSMLPGPGNWQSQSKFSVATTHLDNLGDMMGTSSSGTGGSGGFNGMLSWLSLSPDAHKFVVLQYTADSGKGYIPKVNNLAKTASSGAVVTFVFGRYEYNQIGPNSFILGSRKGGHSVTLARAAQNGSFFNPTAPITLHSRDPWHEEPSFDLNTQSKFANRPYNVGIATHLQLLPFPQTITINTLDFQSGADRVRVIDRYRAIVPLFGYGHTPGGHTINIKKPIKIGGFNPPGPLTIDFGAGALIKDVTLAPDATSLFALVQLPGQPPKLTHVDKVTGEATGVAEFPTGKQLFFGRNRLLYILEDDHLHEVNVDIVPEKPGDPPPIQTKNLPFMADAVSFWDEDDRYLVLSTSAKKLLIYRTDPVANVFAFPPVFEFNLMIPLAGKASMAVHPPDFGGGAGFMPPSLWIVSGGSSSIHRINLQNGGLMQTITHPLIMNPTGISVNDQGELLVSTPTGLFEVKQDVTGALIVGPSMMFDDEMTYEKFYVARSRTNHHPVLHEGPGWENIILDDEFDKGIPDCNADLNHDGFVGVADLLILLASWGPCGLPCPADLDFDGTVGVPDLLELLGSWGPCP